MSSLPPLPEPEPEPDGGIPDRGRGRPRRSDPAAQADPEYGGGAMMVRRAVRLTRS
jgi:hypothetical protein